MEPKSRRCKRLFSVMLSAVLAASTAGPAIFAYARDWSAQDEPESERQLAFSAGGDCTKPDTEGSVSWRVEGNVLTISGDGYMKDYGTAELAPWIEYGSLVDTIVFEDGIKSIGAWSFYLFTLVEKVTIPDSVVSVGGCAFLGCTNLAEVSLNPETQEVGFNAFHKCALSRDFYSALKSVHALQPQTATQGGGIYIPSRSRIRPTVTVDNWTYGEEAPEPVIKGNSGKGKVTLEYRLMTDEDRVLEAQASTKKDDEYEWFAWPPTSAGEYVLRASIAQTTWYYSGEATCPFEVYKATPNVGEVSATVAYGGTLNPAEANVVRTNEDLPGTLALAVDTLEYGTHDYPWVFTPEDGLNYTTAEGTLTLANRTVPDLGEVSATVKHGILDPTKVVFSHTNEEVPGSFTLVADTLSYGSFEYPFVFTPDATDRYETVEGNVTVLADHRWDGWKLVDGRWYYYINDEPLTGWYRSSTYRNWFWLEPSTGAMATSWSFVGGEWYLFDENGTMLTGWQWDKQYQGWYYFNEVHDGTFGRMMRNYVTPDGSQVGPDGRWIA